MILGLILVVTSSLFAQSSKKTIKGKVTTETGEALSGVTVIEVGGAGKALTNEADVYTIQLNSKVTTLKFSYVGYQDTESKINNKSEVNVAMLRENGSLAEVIVVGYGVQQKKGIHWICFKN